jgi:hypothetical protein
MVPSWTPGATAPDAVVPVTALETDDVLVEPPGVAASDGPELANGGTSLVAAATPVDAANPWGVPSLSETLPSVSLQATTQGTPGGLGFGDLALRLDGPRTRTTSRDHETITGRVVGGHPGRVVLFADGTETEVPLHGRAFEIPVTLRRGLNVIRLVAFDTSGSTTEEAVAFDYTPPSAVITITTPDDSHVLVAPGGSAVVEGVVHRDGMSTVSIVAGSREIEVPVENGRFRYALTLDRPATRVWAELRADGAPVVRSAPVTIVRATKPLVVLAMEWPDSATDVEAEVRATWRPRADRLDEATRAPMLDLVREAATELPEFWYLESPQPGVYTFELHYRGQLTGAAVPSVLYVSAEGELKAQRVAAADLGGSPRTVVARLLLPQGLVWDDRDWPAGESQGGDRITRFRFSDGVVWTEAADRR